MYVYKFYSTDCDYELRSHNIIFPINSKTATVKVYIKEDYVYEQLEKFKLMIADPLPSEIKRGDNQTIEVTIQDNEERK